MQNNDTDITVVLDRSGSMSNIRVDMEGGFSEFLKEQKALPGKCTISLNQFDTQFETVYTGLDINDAPELRIAPRDWTALYDAIGKTINTLGDRLSKMPEASRPGKVIVVIVTDGGENASKEFSSQAVQKMIKHQESKYGWNFIYMGANQDAYGVAASIGVHRSKSSNYSNDNAKEVFKNFSGKVGAMRSMSHDQYSLVQSGAEALYNAKDEAQLNSPKQPPTTV